MSILSELENIGNVLNKTIHSTDPVNNDTDPYYIKPAFPDWVRKNVDFLFYQKKPDELFFSNQVVLTNILILGFHC